MTPDAQETAGLVHKSNTLGRFDFGTNTISVQETGDRVLLPFGAGIGHELVHFFQSVATAMGRDQMWLNNNIAVGVSMLAAAESEDDILARMPLYEWAKKRPGSANHPMKTGLRCLSRTLGTLNAQMLWPNTQLKISGLRPRVELDPGYPCFRFADGTEVSIGNHLICESMAFMCQHIGVYSLQNRRVWPFEFSRECPWYGLPWAYLYTGGDNWGLPYYLVLSCWISLLYNVKSHTEDFLYYVCDAKDQNPRGKKYATLLARGKEFSPLLGKIMDQSADEEGNWVLRSLDKICGEMGEPALSQLLDQELTIRRQLAAVLKESTAKPGASLREHYHRFLNGRGIRFLEEVLSPNGDGYLLFAPQALFLDQREQLPLLVYLDGVYCPKDFPEAPWMYQAIKLDEKILFGRSLECYDYEVARDWHHDVIMRCPHFHDCIRKVDKVGLNFCQYEGYAGAVREYLQSLQHSGLETLRHVGQHAKEAYESAAQKHKW